MIPNNNKRNLKMLNHCCVIIKNEFQLCASSTVLCLLSYIFNGFPMIYQMYTKQVYMKIQCVQLSCCFGCTSISFAVRAQIPQKLLYTYSYHHQFKHNEMNYYDLE